MDYFKMVWDSHVGRFQTFEEFFEMIGWCYTNP
jgi:hypothetical protein